MKNLILVSVLFLTIASVSFGSNNPVKSFTLLDVEGVTVTIDNNYKNFFEVAKITDDLSSLDFVTHESVEFVQIYNNAGLVEFQLPVDSKKVRINKSFFDAGKYKLGFKVDGEQELYMAVVKMK